MLWTLGNMPLQEIIYYDKVDGIFITGITLDPNITILIKQPFLLSEITAVTEMSVETRLDLSIIAVLVGLAVSVLLLLLSLPSSLLHRGNDAKLPIEGTGLLHAMWLYRNHPELETLLEQVTHPTNDNLRAAGLVRTTLVGTGRRSSESFPMTRRRKDYGVGS
ncbi:hypothetical protein B0H19DRAFT_1259507 [Mycena capillaripes]|nr:hypothetical protein B0H19DRAFT_1259507 [Mycena capillaripes]